MYVLYVLYLGGIIQHSCFMTATVFVFLCLFLTATEDKGKESEKVSTSVTDTTSQQTTAAGQLCTHLTYMYM